MSHDHKRGKIRHNALAAIVTSETFKTRVQEQKKNPKKYTRNTKHKKQEYYQERLAA